MSTSNKLYGGCANIREFLVAPITAIDIQIQNGYFNGLSVTSHILANPNRKAIYTSDGLYFYYGMASSDLKNDTKDLKTFVKTAGLKLGTDDFTSMVGDEFWVLNLFELEEWIKVTPHNIV